MAHLRPALALAFCLFACGGEPKPVVTTPPAQEEEEPNNAADLLNAASNSGTLSKEAIRRGVQRAMPEISKCYEAGLARDQALGGQVKTQIIIAEDGSVSAAQDAGSTLPDAATLKCMRAAYRRASFEKPNGGSVAFIHPLTLGP